MHIDDNEPMLDIFKSDIFTKSVSENLKENTKKLGVIDTMCQDPFITKKMV